MANTNIEAVFDMLLNMAISNEVLPEELPKQVLIISDMEFDAASSPDVWKGQNEEGICLLSGFSQNAMKIAANREKKDPYESLIQVLDGPRYDAVEKATAKLVA